MPRPASGLAPGHVPPELAEPHLVPLAGEWALWRDIAVRTAGFPVAGLGIFGSPDEQAGLRAVARDPLFRTAATQAGGHETRITIRRTVWRRETWHIPPALGPACSEAAASWARDLGLPQRVFLLSPGELKPIYIDFDSPVLARILCRQLRRATADFPGQSARFTEMLPGPDDCWLADEDGQLYTSELRLVAVDMERRASRRSAHHC